MLALNYHGSRDVRVETVPDPLLVERDDLILRVTATAMVCFHFFPSMFNASSADPACPS